MMDRQRPIGCDLKRGFAQPGAERVLSETVRCGDLETERDARRREHEMVPDALAHQINDLSASELCRRST